MANGRPSKSHETPQKLTKWTAVQNVRNSSSQEGIGETTAIAKTQVSEQLEVCSDLEALPKLNKLLATYTQEEIGEAVDISRPEVASETALLSEMDRCPNLTKLLRS